MQKSFQSRFLHCSSLKVANEYWKRKGEMMELKRSISRFFSSMNKINQLQSGYLEASEEIAALKVSRRTIKEKLRQVRGELEMVGKINNLRKCERKLLKADKRTTVDGLEQLLERTGAQIRKLQRAGDRAFEKREKLKAKAVRQADFEGDYCKGDSSSSPIVVMNKVDDVAAVAKMMELLRPFRRPTCKIGDEVEVGSTDAIREAASKLKVKIDDDGGGDVIAETTAMLEAKVVGNGGAEKKLEAKAKVGGKPNATKMKAVTWTRGN